MYNHLSPHKSLKYTKNESKSRQKSSQNDIGFKPPSFTDYLQRGYKHGGMVADCSDTLEDV